MTGQIQPKTNPVSGQVFTPKISDRIRRASAVKCWQLIISDTVRPFKEKDYPGLHLKVQFVPRSKHMSSEIFTTLTP
jgi:hypothetical protein